MTLVAPSYIATYDRCVCNRRITSEPYYGMLMGEDQDEDAIVYLWGAPLVHG